MKKISDFLYVPTSCMLFVAAPSRTEMLIDTSRLKGRATMSMLPYTYAAAGSVPAAKHFPAEILLNMRMHPEL